MRPFFVASGFVAACSVVVACVGGGGSLPSDVVGGEGTSTSAGSGSGSGGRQDDAPSAQTPPSGTGNGSTEPTQCTPGAACDCGSASFVGTQKCDGEKPTCECKPAPRPDAG